MGTDRFFKTKIDKEEDTSQDNRFVQLTNSIIRHAVRKGASDIHLEVLNKEQMRARIRTDGQLSTVMQMPPEDYFGMVSRIKILANLDISEKRRPQDGSFNIFLENKSIDLRVSFIPALHGEKVVLRILDAERFLLPIDELGFSEKNEKSLQQMTEKANGLLLVTGPTGCGKSTTLYSILKEKNADQTNIVTIEDPIEFQLQGINQIQVNEKIGLGFKEGLRAILRQDPNIIMIGEIRDEQTAATAIRAAITGHLVLSTLHTNDALSAITRLFDMGVPGYLLQAALRGVISQRLLRKLCPRCKKEDTPKIWEMKNLNLKPTQKIYRPQGCQHCDGSGYKGRKGVFEVLAFDEELRRFLTEDGSIATLLKKAEDRGFARFSEAIQKEVLKGTTDVTEGLKVMRYGND